MERGGCQMLVRLYRDGPLLVRPNRDIRTRTVLTHSHAPAHRPCHAALDDRFGILQHLSLVVAHALRHS